MTVLFERVTAESVPADAVLVRLSSDKRLTVLPPA